MATPRERLQSILHWLAYLQNATDVELEAVATELAEADSLLDDTVQTVEQTRAEQED